MCSMEGQRLICYKVSMYVRIVLFRVKDSNGENLAGGFFEAAEFIMGLDWKKERIYRPFLLEKTGSYPRHLDL